MGNPDKNLNVEAIRPQDLRRQNVSHLLAVLSEKGSCTVNELEEQMDLSRTAVRNILLPLISEGIAGPAEKRGSGAQGGKRALSYRIRPDYRYGIFLYLSTGTVVVELTDFSNEQASFGILDVSQVSYEGLLGMLRDEIARLLEKRSLGLSDLYGIAAAVSGSVDSENGILKNLTGSNEPDVWGKDIPLVKDLKERLGFQGEVYLDTMCNFDGYSVSSRLFPGQKGTCLVILAHSKGIGSALIREKQVVRGAHGLMGEMGHATVDYRGGLLCRCGRTGCFETVLYPENIRKAAAGVPGLSGRQVSTLEDLLRLAEAGNREAEVFVKGIAEQFGNLIYNAQLMADPDTVVFHDAFGVHSGLFQSAVYRFCEKKREGHIKVPVRLFFYNEPFAREVRCGAMDLLRKRYLESFSAGFGKGEV